MLVVAHPFRAMVFSLASAVEVSHHSLGHVVIVNDRLILVGGDEEFAAKFHRAASFALADPLGVGLEERENLFLVRDGFSLEDAPLDEVDVLIEHLDKVGQLDEAGALNGTERKSVELVKGGVGLGTQGIGLVKVNACSLLKSFLFVPCRFFLRAGCGRVVPQSC